MSYIYILPILLLLGLTEICCHGNAAERSKLLLISSGIDFNRNIPLKFPHILLRLNDTSHDNLTNLDSIINGCYSKTTAICEPIWVTNQRQKHDSALMNWPNQMVYGDTWPTFSFECSPHRVALHRQLDRLIDWMTRPHTTLGIMTVSMVSGQKFQRFLVNVSKVANEHEWNVIIVSMGGQKRPSVFLAFGPNFVTANVSIRSINMVDINGVIREILLLAGASAHSDGNVTVTALLTTRTNHHVNIGVYNLAVSESIRLLGWLRLKRYGL